MGYQNYMDNQIGFHIHKFKAQVLLNIHIMYFNTLSLFLKVNAKNTDIAKHIRQPKATHTD